MPSVPPLHVALTNASRCTAPIAPTRADKTLPVAERRNYKGIGDAFTRTVKEDGVGGLFRGAGPTIARAMSLNMGMFASNEQAKELLVRLRRRSPASLPFRCFLVLCSEESRNMGVFASKECAAEGLMCVRAPAISSGASASSILCLDRCRFIGTRCKHTQSEICDSRTESRDIHGISKHRRQRLDRHAARAHVAARAAVDGERVDDCGLLRSRVLAAV